MVALLLIMRRQKIEKPKSSVLCIAPYIHTRGPHKAVAQDRYAHRPGLPRASPINYTLNKARGLLSACSLMQASGPRAPER